MNYNKHMKYPKDTKVYSYIRFSSLGQVGNDSIRRQETLAEAWCNQQGLLLDDRLRMQDLGVSAFRGTNVVEGNLGGFLEAIKLGKVPKDSVLLIESLDRLSRDQVLTALGVFSQILQADITIVTLTDDKTYTKESINDIGNLLYSIIIMSRAHEESLMKSKRIKAAWDKKRLDAVNGKPISGNLPRWLKIEDDKFVIIEEYAETVRMIFDLSIKGMGQHKIARTLNEQGIITFGTNRKAQGWSASTIKHMQKDGKVIGDYSPTTSLGGKRIILDVIHDYYPAVIDKDLYYKVQTAISSRHNQGGRIGSAVNLFAGVIFCTCGSKMVRMNSGNGYSMYFCDFTRRGMAKCSGYMRTKDVQQAVKEIIEETDVDAAYKNHTKSELDVTKELKEYTDEDTKLTKQINSYIKALEVGDVSVLVKRLQQAESRQNEVKSKILELSQHKSNLEDYAKMIKQIGLMLGQVKESDVEVAMRARTLIRRYIIKVVIDIKLKKVTLEI